MFATRTHRHFTFSTLRVLAATLVVLSLASCTNYFQVTDPASGKVFYTKDIDQNQFSGAVEFIDAKDGGVVTLPSSRVVQVSQEQFVAAVGTK